MVRIGRGPERSELEARALLDGVAPGRGRTLWSETLAVIPGDLSGRNLEEYAELLARGQGVEDVRRAPPGWCSWYHYFTGIDQGSVLENLEKLSGEHRDLGIEVVQVDDGYAPAPGDWLEAGGGFPDGMESLARRISSRGKVPGIWVAPFTVTRRSRTFREKKDWLQRRPVSTPTGEEGSTGWTSPAPRSSRGSGRCSRRWRGTATVSSSWTSWPALYWRALATTPGRPGRRRPAARWR